MTTKEILELADLIHMVELDYREAETEADKARIAVALNSLKIKVANMVLERTAA